MKISLYTFLQILSVSAFERLSLNQLLAEYDYKSDTDILSNQLNLFN